MTTYRHLTDLADAARKSGLRVVELPGWQTRGRPAATGGFDPHGVLCHHTGGAEDGRGYALWLAQTGRSDLPAPLCQLSLDREGTVYVCAAGRANHAGVARASGPMPKGDGNTLYLGIEAQNTGSEGWTPVQYAAYVHLAAALCQHYGWPADHVRAHKETSVTGKVDPGRMDMDQFRADVAQTMKGDEDMATPEEVAHEILWTKLKNGGYVEWNLRDIQARAARLENALAALAAGISPAVEAAVKEALTDATVSVDVNVTGGAAK